MISAKEIKLRNQMYSFTKSCKKNQQELTHKMNTEIDKLANWFRANKMAVNISITKYVIFHTKGKKFNFNNNSIVCNRKSTGSYPNYTFGKNL